MLADQRHAQILDIVNGEGSATVVDLAARLGISESTVRRDLEKLDDSGCLSKVHGGAVASPWPSERPSTLPRSAPSLSTLRGSWGRGTSCTSTPAHRSTRSLTP